MEPRTWRSSPLTLGTAYVVLAVSLLTAIGGLVARVALRDSFVALAIALVSAGAAFAGWRSALLPHLAVVAHGVHVHNPWRTYHVAWSDLVDVESGYGGIVIQAQDRNVTAWAIQKANISSWLHRETRSDHIVTEILRSRPAR